MLYLWLAALVAFALDQISKYVVIHTMELSRLHHIDVWSPFLTYRYGENRGINFGLFDQADGDLQRWILIGFSMLVVLAVIYWVRKAGAGLWMQIAAGLLVGGALGNVLDRIWYGYVLDFVNMSCCGINNPFVFNIADVFIFAGAIGLILLDSFGGRDKA